MGARRRAVLGSRTTASGGQQTADAAVRPKTKYLESDQLPDYERQCAQQASCLVLIGGLRLQYGLVRPQREPEGCKVAILRMRSGILPGTGCVKASVVPISRA
jgi:hypothetical protein